MALSNNFNVKNSKSTTQQKSSYTAKSSVISSTKYISTASNNSSAGITSNNNNNISNNFTPIKYQSQAFITNSSSSSGSSNYKNISLQHQSIAITNSLQNNSNKYESPYKANGYKSIYQSQTSTKTSPVGGGGLLNQNNFQQSSVYNNNHHNSNPSASIGLIVPISAGIIRPTARNQHILQKSFGVDNKYLESSLYKSSLLSRINTGQDAQKLAVTAGVSNRINSNTGNLMNNGGIAAVGPNANNTTSAQRENRNKGDSNSNVDPTILRTATEEILNSKNPYINALTKDKKGYLIIFNHEKFKESKLNRDGSRNDELELCRSFWNYNLKSPIIKRDLKQKAVMDEVKKLTTLDFRKYTCFVCVILSHGDENDEIITYDSLKYNLEKDFINRIATNRTLLGKPKIFIINACKGGGEFNGSWSSTKKLQSDAVPYDIPFVRDILTIFSTYEGFVSYRDPTKGTIFIQTFCRTLREYGSKLSIEDIVKNVNAELTGGKNQNKQVPSVKSSMSANFYFGDLLK